MIHQGKIDHKIKHIEEQIADIKALRTEANKDKVDSTVNFQKWRLELLKAYSIKKGPTLQRALNKLKTKIEPDIWEKRKTIAISLLNEETAKAICEVAIIEFLQGEYETKKEEEGEG